MADGADRKDADLVVDVRAGSAESFAALFDRWFGPVLGAAQDIVGEQTEAARVATDTFQSVWLHLDELADPDGFGAWVLLTSRTFARQRQAERDPSAVAPSGPLFDNEDELRRAVAKVLCRRQVPALGEVVRVGAGMGGADPEPTFGAGPDPIAEVPDTAPDRLHRYHWAVTEPAPGVADRIRTFRLSPGTVVALAIVLLGSVIWLISRDDTSQIDGGRPAPLFSPASPTTIDGAAARAGNGAAVPGGEVTPPGSVAPDPAAPTPTDAVAPAESRKVKVATVLPRAVATTPGRRGTTVAPAAAVPITAVPITTVPTPLTDRPPSTTTTVAPTSATTASTARTSTTAGSTSTSTTARTTTTGRGGSTTTSGSTTTTGGGSTTTTGRGGSTTTSGATTTTRGGSTTTTAAVTTSTTRATTTSTTRATTTTTGAVTTSRPATTSALVSAARVTASSTVATPALGAPLND